MWTQFVLLALAFLGGITSLYLIVASILKKETICFIGRDCDKVAKSNYRAIFLFPNALWGLIFYAAVGWAAIYGFDRFGFEYYILTLIIAIVAVTGSLYSYRLQRTLSKSYCRHCLAAAFINILILLLIIFER